jgi:phage baseplate assembly protein W
MAKTLHNRITLPGKSSAATPRSQMYRGFSSVNVTSENFRLYDFELIKQDIINHFNIRQGERLMNPQFGCIIWALIFEPLTEQVKDIVLQNINTIINYDPRVQAENVVVTAYDTGLQIQCILKYLPYNIQQNLQLKFDQKNGLMTA